MHLYLAIVIIDGNSCFLMDVNELCYVAKTQDVFNPVQQVVAHGCHLDRDTDKLFASHVGGDLARSGGRYFRALLEEQYLLLPYQWPISRQYFAVYQK